MSPVSFALFGSDWSRGVSSGSSFVSRRITCWISGSWDRLVLERCGGSIVISAGMSGIVISLLLCSFSRNNQFTKQIDMLM